MDYLTFKMLESVEADNANDVQRCYTSNQIYEINIILKFLLPWEARIITFENESIIYR